MAAGAPDVDIVFIVNPISGRRIVGPERIRRIEHLIHRERWNAAVWQTEGPGHAPELAGRAVRAGVRRVVGVGGDGTLNEIARELVNTECEFGLVPMGSGNGLARHVGIPLHFERALLLAATGRIIRMDTGEANGKPFFNVMGVGFDAEVGRRFNEMLRRGFFTYLKLGWRTFRDYRCLDCTIRAGDERRRLSAYIVAVANASQYGSNAYIAPDASLTDGKLNLVAISQPSFISFFVLIWRMFRKKIYLSPRVTQLCAASFVLEFSDKGFFHVDGEIFPRDRELVVRALPGSLSIVAVPQDATQPAHV